MEIVEIPFPYFHRLLHIGGGTGNTEWRGQLPDLLGNFGSTPWGAVGSTLEGVSVVPTGGVSVLPTRGLSVVPTDGLSVVPSWGRG